MTGHRVHFNIGQFVLQQIGLWCAQRIDANAIVRTAARFGLDVRLVSTQVVAHFVRCWSIRWFAYALQSDQTTAATGRFLEVLGFLFRQHIGHVRFSIRLILGHLFLLFDLFFVTLITLVRLVFIRIV